MSRTSVIKATFAKLNNIAAAYWDSRLKGCSTSATLCSHLWSQISYKWCLFLSFPGSVALGKHTNSYCLNTLKVNSILTPLHLPSHTQFFLFCQIVERHHWIQYLRTQTVLTPQPERGPGRPVCIWVLWMATSVEGHLLPTSGYSLLLTASKCKGIPQRGSLSNLWIGPI